MVEGLRDSLGGYVGGRDARGGTAALITALRDLFGDVKMVKDMVMLVWFLNVLR